MKPALALTHTIERTYAYGTEEGDRAPAFTLLTPRRSIVPERFLGEPCWFLSGAFTGVCTKEMCTFRDRLPRSIPQRTGRGSALTSFANKAFAA